MENEVDMAAGRVHACMVHYCIFVSFVQGYVPWELLILLIDSGAGPAAAHDHQGAAGVRCAVRVPTQHVAFQYGRSLRVDHTAEQCTVDRRRGANISRYF